MLLCFQKCQQMILILRDCLKKEKEKKESPSSRLVFLILREGTVYVPHSISLCRTLSHINHHFTLKKRSWESKSNRREGKRTEGGEGGWQSADEEQWGGGHSLPKQLWISQSQWRRTSAGAFLPHAGKNEWKARRANAYESSRNKYKSVSRAVTRDFPPLLFFFFFINATSSSVNVCVCVCVHSLGVSNK